VRSPNLRLLEDLKGRVVTCLEAGTLAAGCRMDHRWQEFAYSDMLDNGPMLDLYAANSARLGRPLEDPNLSAGVVGSTDMGNVSYLAPSIHPMVKVAPAHVSIHSPEFTRYAVSGDGDRAVIDGAKALAMTVIDLWTNADHRAAAQQAFTIATDRDGGATPG
jgi:metal-dependent amidase/aminoacylase/carboxypeptidase family protein